MKLLKNNMKIRYYRNLNGARWLGFFIAMTSVWILSNANISTQWVGWVLSMMSCSMWVYFGYKDKDWPRAIMECAYLVFSMRAVYNWLII